jgi:DNA repair exonuclease SbcCD nuclease subunit
MSKIICFGDIHIHHTHKFSKIESEGYSIREQEHMSCANDICNLIDKYSDCERVVFLGDLFGPVGDVVSCQSLMVATEIIDKIAKKCTEKNISFDMLVGNHDVSSYVNNKYSHKLYPFKNYPNVTVYDQPTEVGNYIYAPYCNSDGYATNFLESIKDKKNKIIFSHLEIQYVDLGSGICTSKGIEQELLKNFKMTISGHYHSGNNIAKNIKVCGSTQRLSFKDKGISRNNIIVYDTETNECIRENFNCPDWICFTDENINDILLLDTNNYVHVEVMFDKLITDEILNKLNTFKGYEVHTQLNRISIKMMNNEAISTNKDTQKSNLEILKEFIDRSEGSFEDKEKLLEEGRRLLSNNSSN